MKKILMILLLAGSTLAGLQSCYYDKFDEIHPAALLSGDCDTANVTYGGSVAPIMNSYCSGCHSGSSPQGGYDLSNYEGVKLSVDNLRLLGTIKHESGYSPMPKGSAAPMNACNITLIQKWVNAGAPNN